MSEVENKTAKVYYDEEAQRALFGVRFVCPLCGAQNRLDAVNLNAKTPCRGCKEDLRVRKRVYVEKA